MLEFAMGVGAGTFVGWYLTHVLRGGEDPRSLDFYRTHPPDSGVHALYPQYPEAVDTELVGPTMDPAA